MEFTAKFVFSTIKRACEKINSKPVVIMGVNCINDTEWKCNARINKYLFKISFLMQACCGRYFFGLSKPHYSGQQITNRYYYPLRSSFRRRRSWLNHLCLCQFPLSSFLHKYTKYQVNLITGSVKVNVHDLLTHKHRDR